ncbi:MAG TPA: DoxX family protein [Streptomyces sp.]|nr:DoxX family protein [Streptomyces sp.]
MTPPTMLNPVTTGTTRQAPSPHAYDVGLLILRLGLGLTMAAHGVQKLFGWFGGSGLDGTAQFFAASGYPAAKAMAVVAALTETFGGLGLAIGLFTPLAGAAVVGTMLNAMAVAWSGAFFVPDGVEYVVVLTAAAAALTLTGPGGLAVDRFVPVLRAHRFTHGAAALALGVVLAGVVLLFRD